MTRNKGHCEHEPEIEITPEMIEAGALEVARGNPDYFSDEEIAVKVYRAMEKARTIGPNLVPCPRKPE